MNAKEYSNIRIRTEDLDCVSEMALDLEMELIDFISLLVSDAAKTILTPTLPSLCQIIVSRRLSQHNHNNQIINLDSPKKINNINGSF